MNQTSEFHPASTQGSSPHEDLSRIEVQQIINQYRESANKIPEVKEIRYRLHKKGIEFIVIVDRVRRKLSQQLANIESQLYDEYPGWFFDFEHLSYRSYKQQTQNEYFGLFRCE